MCMISIYTFLYIRIVNGHKAQISIEILYHNCHSVNSYDFSIFSEYFDKIISNFIIATIYGIFLFHNNTNKLRNNGRKL